jgi:hypothetical protein
VVRLWNNLNFDLQLFYLTEFGTRAGLGMLPGGYAGNYWLANGYYVVFTCLATGSFVGVASIVSGVDALFLGRNYMVPPNSLGMPPQPTAEAVVPPDSPRVLVASGLLRNGNHTLREQYWRRMPDSYSIAPGETQTVSTSTSTNMQQTSSDTTTVAASMSASASAGWGPMSASLSASLSASSTHAQEVSISTENTSYVSDTLTGTGTAASMFLKWQIMDVVSVVSPGGEVLSSLISGMAPVLVQGPYDATQLPAAKVRQPALAGAIGSPRTAVSGRAFVPQCRKAG